MTELDAELQITKNDTHCEILITSSDGAPLTAQLILDAVSDMLMQYYSLSPEDWKKMEESELN
jgi:hypothetical protein